MLAITNGKILTMNAKGQTYASGTILIEGKKIINIGEEVVIPADAEVIDAAGKFVLPGFIDAHCHVGILEEVYQIEGDDVNELTDPITPHLRVIDGINPEDEGFRDALSGGITTVVTTPGSANVIGGQMTALKTAGKTVEDMVLKELVGLKVAFGENPKRVYGNQKKMPATRMATAALLRETLVKAQNYQNKVKMASKSEENFERDLKLELVVKVLQGEIPLRAHAHRADDIMTAIRIAEEFNVKLVIEHCTEGHKIADILAQKEIPAIVGPVLTSRAKVELKDKTPKTPKILSEAGVKVGLMTDHPVIPINYLSLCAGLSQREGLSEEEALRMITIYPAQILGLDAQIGSLEPGKDADIIIVDGPPLELQSHVISVYIDGVEVYSKV